MNKNFVFSLIVFFLIFLSSQTYSQSSSDSTIQEYKILEINRVKKGFIIKVLNIDKDQWFAIVTNKGKVDKCAKIKVGNSYKMNLHPYFESDMFPDHILIYLVKIGEEEIVVPSEGWATNVYTTPNLYGLCYLKP